MFKNIKHNNVRSLGLKLRTDEYYDFMLYKGECVSTSSENCIVADIKPYNMSDGKVISECEWDEAVNDGVLLENIGFTGIDNGLITFRKDKVSNSQFLNIFTGSTYDLGDDKRFFMVPVSGNSNQYKYFYTLEDDDKGGYISLNGGFLQGFYKIQGMEYQTLPNVMENDWNFEVTLRRKNYDVHYRTINHTHPDNNGIFFYIGTRAENKFWWLYKKKDNINDLYDHENTDGGYFADFIPDLSSVIDTDYFSLSEDKIQEPQKDYIENSYSTDDYFDFTTNNPVGGYFIDSYGGFEEACYNQITDYNPIGEYYEKEISLRDVLVKTNKGHEIGKKGYFEIKTDNKFITFDHTKYGFTTKTFDPENPYVIYEGRKDWKTPNYFVLMNHTATGYTTDTIQDYLEENSLEFDVYKDIRDNAFGVKINEDGSIEYRYGIMDCDSDNTYKVEKETSKPNLIPMDEWVTINIRCCLLNSNGDMCSDKIGKRKMKLFFYVNGDLVLVSKELPEFRFRGLDDDNEKQEGVPFNISLGGGTQGLCDAIWLNYYEKPDYRLPLERDFCGSFLGDIRSFRFYNCFLDYNSINYNVFRG